MSLSIQVIAVISTNAIIAGTCVWKLSALLTEIRTELKAMRDLTTHRLDSVEARLLRLEPTKR